MVDGERPLQRALGPSRRRRAGADDAEFFTVSDGGKRVAVLASGTLFIHALPSFTVERRLEAPDWARNMALGDLDGDGGLDAVFAGGAEYYDEGSVSAMDLATGRKRWQLVPTEGIADVAIGDFTDDPGNEVVLASATGHVLAGPTGASLWQYPLGFGKEVLGGQFDGDPALEFAVRSDYDVQIIDARLKSPLLALDLAREVGSLRAGDFDNDGRAEVVAGARYEEGVDVFDTMSGRRRHTVGAAWNSHITQLSVGDANGDGAPDVLSGFRCSPTASNDETRSKRNIIGFASVLRRADIRQRS